MTAASLGCGSDPPPPSGTGGAAPTSCSPFDDEQRTPTALAVDETDVFWTILGPNPTEGAVLKASKSCGPTTTLVSGLQNPIAIAIDATHVYWLDDKALSRVPKAGGAPEVLAVLEAPLPIGGSIAVDDARVYYSAAHGVLDAVDKSGGTPTQIASVCILGNIALDDTHVYFSDRGCSGNLVRIPKAGGPAEIFMPRAFSVDVAIDASNLYWWQDSAGIVSRPKSGGDGRILAGYAHQESTLAIDRTRVYYSNLGSLTSVEKSGGGAEFIDNGSLKIATDGASVFWTSKTGIHKAARPADTGVDAPPTGEGSLELLWTIDRGQHCVPGSIMKLVLAGPTGVVSSVPCTDHAHTVTGLAPGDYHLRMEDASAGLAIAHVANITIGSGPAQVHGPIDFGECRFGGCSTVAVGCVSDGVCDEQDDCVCPDCAGDAYCNPGAKVCPTDGICTPHYEGCSCSDCAKNASCL